MFEQLLLVGVLVWKIISDELHRKQIQKLEDRLMARNFDEYKYFEHKFPKDVEIVAKAQEKAVEVEHSFNEVESDNTKKFIDGLEEDWKTDEIDKARIPENINESKINRKEDSSG